MSGQHQLLGWSVNQGAGRLNELISYFYWTKSRATITVSQNEDFLYEYA
jgi:hypothetical protein